jgi:cob(I)alamin adenosyltransferase
MTVNLTRIHTRLCDDGETHPRIEAYGTVDELNAQLRATLTLDGLLDGYLRRGANGSDQPLWEPDRHR